MPLRVEMDHRGRLITAVGEGLVTVDEVLHYYRTITATGELMRYRKLFDAGDCHMDLTSDDLMTLGAWTSAFAAFDPRGPIAIVASTPHNENIMRGYMAVGVAPRALKLFKTRGRAVKWLAAQKAP